MDKKYCFLTEMFNAGRGQKILQSAEPDLDAVTVSLAQLGQEAHHDPELRVPHVALRQQDAEGGPAVEAPAAGDELELGPDVLGEQRHVVREVELGRGEDQRVAEDRLAGHAVQLARAQRS